MFQTVGLEQSVAVSRLGSPYRSEAMKIWVELVEKRQLKYIEKNENVMYSKKCMKGEARRVCVGKFY